MRDYYSRCSFSSANEMNNERMMKADKAQFKRAELKSELREETLIPKEVVMVKKYLVTIEFRYCDVLSDETEIAHKTKTITIGIYDEFSSACENGNDVLKTMEDKFSLHEFPDGRKADKERLSRINNLVSNLAYLKTPFQFYLKITDLKYVEINEAINDVLESVERYKNWKNTTEN